MSIFLQEPDMASLLGNEMVIEEMAGAFIGGLITLIIIAVLVYLYFSVAYYKIAEKAGSKNPGVSWIPGWGSIVIIFETASMHWWPFLVTTLGIGLGYLVIFMGMLDEDIAIVGAIIIAIVTLLFIAMATIWHYKTYEAIHKPGWWAAAPIIAIVAGYLLAFIPYMTIIGISLAILGILAHLVFLGMAAFGK